MGTKPAPQIYLDRNQGTYTVTPPVPDSRGTWLAAPLLQPPSKMSSLSTSPSDGASPRSVPDASLSSLTRAQLEARLRAADAAVERYNRASRALLAALALSPAANAQYAGVARGLLREALLALETVSSVEHCECSMPAVASGAELPVVDLVRYDGLDYCEWECDWRPKSWWLSVSLRTVLGLSVSVRVSEIRVEGLVRVALSEDVSSLRLAFSGSPRIELGIDTRCSVGSIPVPLRDTIDEGIRTAVTSFVEDNLINGNSMLFVLRRKNEELGDEDVAAATEAAQRHSSITSL